VLEKTGCWKFRDPEKLEPAVDYKWVGSKPTAVERFKQLSCEEVDLYEKKNYDYTKGGNEFGNFERVGQILKLYPGLDNSDPVVVSLIYMLKQLDCVLWAKNQKYNPSVEGIGQRLQDVYVYAKIARMMEEELNDPRTSA
jgi:hypothetical protein